MADPRVRDFLHHLYAQDTFPTGVKMVVVLENGLTVRGQVVSAEQWEVVNWAAEDADSRQERDQCLSDAGLDNQAAGSWPARYRYPYREHERRGEYLHLVNVEYLSGGSWAKGSSLSIPTKHILAKGDQW